MLKRTHCNDILCQFLERVHHDSHSPGATNTLKCKSPFGFGEILPDLSYIVEIAKKRLLCLCARRLLGRQNAGSGLQLNDLQTHRLTNHFSSSMHSCAWYPLTPCALKLGHRGFVLCPLLQANTGYGLFW